MNNIFIDVDYAQIFKHGQKIGGDVFLLSRNPENNQIVSTLSDGLGSGVKANVLASLTAHMAHRLSFSPIDLSHSAKIIMDTLPVCKERKISYSTFTIADIRYGENMEHIAVNLVEYDAFNMQIGERLVMFSDGVTQSGLGKSLPLGWRLDGVRRFISEEIAKQPDISSRELSRAIVQKAYSLDGLSAKDDITCVVIYIRRPRRLLIVTGPPFTKEADAVLGDKIRSFDGKKIVSGGTTAQIVSRLFGKKLTLDLSSWSKDVPPASKMEGIDLVTEGMLTLSKVASILEKKTNPADLPNDPAKKFVEMLLDSDQVHFIVGTKINEAHQDPNIPVEIGIRRTIIGRLRKALEEIYLKETSQEYL